MAGELQQIVSSEITIVDITDGATIISYFSNNKHGNLNFSYDPNTAQYEPKFPTLEEVGQDYPLVITPECYRSTNPTQQLISGGISTAPETNGEFFTSSQTANYKWTIDGVVLTFKPLPDEDLVAISPTQSVKVKSCNTVGYESIKCDGTNLIIFRSAKILSPLKTSTGVKFNFDYLDPAFEGLTDSEGLPLPGVPVAMTTAIKLTKQGIGRNYIDMWCEPSNYFYNAGADEVIKIHADSYYNGVKQGRDGLEPGSITWSYTSPGQTGTVVKSFWWYYDDIDNMFLPLNVAGDGVGDITSDRVDGDFNKPTTDITQGETDTSDSYGVDPASTFDELHIREKIVYGSEIFQYFCHFKEAPVQEYKATQVIIDYTDPVVVFIESDSGNVFKHGANNTKKIRSVVKEKESATSASAGDYIELSDEQAMLKYNFKWVLFDKAGKPFEGKAPKQKGESDTAHYRWVKGVLSIVDKPEETGWTVTGVFNNPVCYISRADVHVTGNLRVSVSKKPEEKQTLRTFLKL